MEKSYLSVLEERGIRPFLKQEDYDALQSFDPVVTYKMEGEGHVFDSLPHLKREVGKNTNLIRDMCWYGASSKEFLCAIRHGMVLLVAEKEHLNWKQSALDNGVELLRDKYRRFRRRSIFSERERLVIAAYTGYIICSEDITKITPFIEMTLGHTIRTSEPFEIPVEGEIRKAFKDEFISICRRYHVFEGRQR